MQSPLEPSAIEDVVRLHRDLTSTVTPAVANVRKNPVVHKYQMKGLIEACASEGGVR